MLKESYRVTSIHLIELLGSICILHPVVRHIELSIGTRAELKQIPRFIGCGELNYQHEGIPNNTSDRIYPPSAKKNIGGVLV